MDDDGELLLLLDRDIDEDCELLNRPERRALLLPVALDFDGMLFNDGRGDVCSGGVGGLATFSTSPLPLADFFLRDGILPIFFFAVDGAEEEDDDDDGLIAVLILQQLQYYTTKLCSRLMLVSCDSNYYFFGDYRHFIGK